MQVKVEMGEWLTVYQRFVGWVEIPDGEKVSEENIKKYIDEKGVDFEKNEYDWTTEEHEDWDFDGLKVLDIKK